MHAAAGAIYFIVAGPQLRPISDRAAALPAFFAPQLMLYLSRFEVNSSQTFAAGGGQGWSEGVPLGRFRSAQGSTAPRA